LIHTPRAHTKNRRRDKKERSAILTQGGLNPDDALTTLARGASAELSTLCKLKPLKRNTYIPGVSLSNSEKHMCDTHENISLSLRDATPTLSRPQLSPRGGGGGGALSRSSNISSNVRHSFGGRAAGEE
jgi:hypothetical protein